MEHLQKETLWLIRQKYLFSGPLQKKFTDPWLKALKINDENKNKKKIKKEIKKEIDEKTILTEKQF